MRHDLPANFTARRCPFVIVRYPERAACAGRNAPWVNEVRVCFFRHTRDIGNQVSLKVRVLSEGFVPLKRQRGYRYTEGNPSKIQRRSHILLLTVQAGS